MNAAHRAALQALYSPTAAELASQIPGARSGLDTALKMLEERPTAAAVALVKLQLNAVAALVDELRTVWDRENAR